MHQFGNLCTYRRKEKKSSASFFRIFQKDRRTGKIPTVFVLAALSFVRERVRGGQRRRQWACRWHVLPALTHECTHLHVPSLHAQQEKKRRRRSDPSHSSNFRNHVFFRSQFSRLLYIFFYIFLYDQSIPELAYQFASAIVPIDPFPCMVLRN